MRATLSSAKSRFACGLVVALIVFCLDQLSKWAILASFRPPGVETTPFVSLDRLRVLPILDFVLT